MSLFVKIDCKSNDQGAYCRDKRIKRSLLGLGVRCCSEYHNAFVKKEECPYKTLKNKKAPPPPSPKPKSVL